MKLLIIRHAKALEREEWLKKPDDERPLTAEGIEEFTQVVQSLLLLLPEIDQLYMSPCTRTVQTAEILLKAYSKTKSSSSDILLQGTPWKDVHAFLVKQEWNKDQVIAIVGHENHLSITLGNLISCSNDSAIRFKKGGAALVDLGLMEGKVSGKLLWFISPKTFIKLQKKSS